MTTLDDFIGQTALGQATSTAALVIALDNAGILPRTAYCAELRQLWRDMPEDAAGGPAGAVVEEILDLLEPRQESLVDCPQDAGASVLVFQQAG